jgi:phage shock protein PspC (stress-responsive transcriptional regulator)
VRRLVRDPYSKLGGVASGIGHHYGLDVSIVRIAFCLLTLFSGTGLFAYLVAWMVIPRAEHWPPAGPARPIRSLRGRDIGVLLTLAGIVVALAVGAGATGSILVPLALVVGGVWLLVQPANQPAADGAESYRATGSPPPPPTQPPAGAYSAAPVGAPVPRRSRRRAAAITAAFATAFLVFIVTPLVLIGGVVFLVATDRIDIDEPAPIDLTPASVSDLPASIDEDSAQLVVDLTMLEPSELANLDEPAQLAVDVDFGEIVVLVPRDLDVSIDAAASLGEVEVLGQIDNGFSPDLSHRDAGADLELDLEIGLGHIEVRYADR